MLYNIMRKCVIDFLFEVNYTLLVENVMCASIFICEHMYFLKTRILWIVWLRIQVNNVSIPYLW